MTKQTLILAFSLLSFASPAFGQNEASLFFTPTERQTIESEIRQNPPEQTVRSKHLLHLSSILYFAPDRWTIWLQGRRFTPQTQAPDITILQVTADAVSLHYKRAGSSETIQVTLRPHQSVNLLSGSVSEGYASR